MRKACGTIDDDLGHGCVPGLSWQQRELNSSKLPETRTALCVTTSFVLRNVQ